MDSASSHYSPFHSSRLSNYFLCRFNIYEQLCACAAINQSKDWVHFWVSFRVVVILFSIWNLKGHDCFLWSYYTLESHLASFFYSKSYKLASIPTHKHEKLKLYKSRNYLHATTCVNHYGMKSHHFLYWHFGTSSCYALDAHFTNLNSDSLK
jgi:hypothetical protein